MRLSLIKIFHAACYISLLIFLLTNYNSALPALQENSKYCHNTVWERIIDQFSFIEHTNQKLVKFYIDKYKKDTSHLKKVSKISSPYVYHVISEVEKRRLPSELAIIPMVESNYTALAKSNMGAAGIWQLGNTTGKRYGIKQDSWYDGRHDIYDSTIAALDYLEFLYNEFNQDWFLALAAYNSGEGRVKKAIKTNQLLNKPTDYWSLPLPKETKHFVPKLLAICHLLRNAEKFNIALEYVANNPYFTNIKLTRQIGLHEAARLANVHIDDIKTLNPGYKQTATHPYSPHQLLLPIRNVEVFKQNLSKQAIYKNAYYNNYHIVQNGETLSLIANKYSTNVNSIKKLNNLNSDKIFSGTRLIITST